MSVKPPRVLPFLQVPSLSATRHLCHHPLSVCNQPPRYTACSSAACSGCALRHLRGDEILSSGSRYRARCSNDLIEPVVAKLFSLLVTLGAWSHLQNSYYKFNLKNKRSSKFPENPKIKSGHFNVLFPLTNNVCKQVAKKIKNKQIFTRHVVHHAHQRTYRVGGATASRPLHGLFVFLMGIYRLFFTPFYGIRATFIPRIYKNIRCLQSSETYL